MSLIIHRCWHCVNKAIGYHEIVALRVDITEMISVDLALIKNSFCYYLMETFLTISTS